VNRIEEIKVCCKLAINTINTPKKNQSSGTNIIKKISNFQNIKLFSCLKNVLKKENKKLFFSLF